MALPPPRTPPRFVPTLTEVVQVPGAEPAPGAPPAPWGARAAALPPLPAARPAPVPVVARPPLPSAQPPAVMVSPATGTPPRSVPDGMEETMVHRVMQRVDVVLDQRLREAIAAVVQEQTRSVLPRLREEIESVVRNAVYEAVADELASGVPQPPKG